MFSRFFWFLLSSVQFSLLSSYFTSTPVLDLFNRLFPEFFLRLFSLHTFSASPSCFQCFSVYSPHLCFSRLTPPAPELFCISVLSLSSHPLCSHDPAVLVPWCSSMFICSLYCRDPNYTSSVVVPTCRLVLLAPPSCNPNPVIIMTCVVSIISKAPIRI